LYLPLMYRYSFLSTSCASAVWITLAVRLPLKRVGLSCVRLWSDQWKPKVTCKVLWRHRGPILGDLIDVPLSIWSNGGSTMSDDGAQQQCLQLNWQSLSRSPLCWARSPIMTMTDHVTMMMTCRTSVFMTLWRTHTSIHDITTKYPKPAELTIWLVIQKV
jgi:hypothetical protein